MDTEASSVDKISKWMRTAKVSFGVYIALVLIGLLLIIIGIEFPGPAVKSNPGLFGNIGAMFGQFDFEFPPRMMNLIISGGIVFGVGVIPGMIASIFALSSMLKSSWSIRIHLWGIIILLFSLPSVVFVIFSLIMN